MASNPANDANRGSNAGVAPTGSASAGGAPAPEGDNIHMDSASVINRLQAEIDTLQQELAGAKNEVEFATLKEEELEMRISKHEDTIKSLSRQLQVANQDLSQYESAKSVPLSGREFGLESEVVGLRRRVHELEAQLRRQQVQPQQQPETKNSSGPAGDAVEQSATANAGGDDSGEGSLLTAAYQQISVLNTQLAHLCTELTMARSEAQQLRSVATSQQPALEGGQPGQPGQPGQQGQLALPLPASEAATQGVVAAIEAQRSSSQIADLVSDVRHLQLDLEYHQQKVDQLLQEKQSNMVELKTTKGELTDAKKRIEEQDRLLKHRQVDLDHLQEELRTTSLLSSAPQATAADGAATLDALRSEAAAKDSALVVSHYELHKEKLMRDRLEQKNVKLMERMQKLMMVVETMRRDTVALEKSLATKDKQCEERTVQLTQMTQRARQLHRMVKTGKAGSRDPKGQSGIILDFDSSGALESLPGFRKQRSIDSARGNAGGSRSGHSTPRTPRTPRVPPMTYHNPRT